MIVQAEPIAELEERLGDDDPVHIRKGTSLPRVSFCGTLLLDGGASMPKDEVTLDAWCEECVRRWEDSLR